MIIIIFSTIIVFLFFHYLYLSLLLLLFYQFLLAIFCLIFNIIIIISIIIINIIIITFGTLIIGCQKNHRKTSPRERWLQLSASDLKLNPSTCKKRKKVSWTKELRNTRSWGPMCIVTEFAGQTLLSGWGWLDVVGVWDLGAATDACAALWSLQVICSKRHHFWSFQIFSKRGEGCHWYLPSRKMSLTFRIKIERSGIHWRSTEFFIIS